MRRKAEYDPRVLLHMAVAGCIGWAGFAAPVTYPSSADQVVLVDGDDLLASGNQVDEQAAFSSFANRGDGTFAPEALIATRFGERLQAVADLNGDGISDLVASDYWSSGIVIHLGGGSGTLYGTATHGGPTLIAGNTLFSLSFGSGNPVRLHVFPVNGDGSLGTKTTFETGLANGDSASMRTRGDAVEILVNERSGNLGLIRYANGGISVSRLPTGDFDVASTFADLNADGIADIVFTRFDGGVFVTLANADGTFGEHRRIASQSALPNVVRVADLDGDGNEDVVVADFQQPHLYWFRGDGAGGFAEGVAIDAGGPVNAFVIADLDGDGRPDLVTANENHTLSVLINRGGCGAPRRRAPKH